MHYEEISKFEIGKYYKNFSNIKILIIDILYNTLYGDCFIAKENCSEDLKLLNDTVGWVKSNEKEWSEFL
jgi:hypothetical protein